MIQLIIRVKQYKNRKILKRTLSILLAFCVLFTNTGWALTAHYCMGERVSVNLSHLTPDDGLHECDKCGMEKTSSSNGCCHDEEVIIKGSQDALSSLHNIDIPFGFANLPIVEYVLILQDGQIYASEKTTPFQAHGPPGLVKIPLYMRNCAFLI